jgi:hypothetical protein
MSGLQADLTADAALLVAAAALLVGTAALLRTRRLAPALALTLDLLTAAGLLRLAATQTWAAIGGAALVVLLRRLLAVGLHRGSAVAWRWPHTRAGEDVGRGARTGGG